MELKKLIQIYKTLCELKKKSFDFVWIYNRFNKNLYYP